MKYMRLYIFIIEVALLLLALFAALRIIAGIIVSLLVLALGQETMQNALLNANLPKIARHLVPKGSIDARMEKLSEEIKAKLYDDLEKEKNDEITERLVKEISEQIEGWLTKMAEVVEIPLS